MRMSDGATDAIVVDYLANHRGCIEELARWSYSEWRPIYDHRGLTLDDVAAAIRSRANVDAIPLALVALWAGRVVGTISLKEQDLEIRPDLTPWLGGLFVVPECRGCGIGTVLVGRLIDEAQRLNIGGLYLWTPSAEGLYTRLGWSLVEAVAYCGQRISIMHRKIGG